MGEEAFLQEILDKIKQKRVVSDLDKDLLSTIEEYVKTPFDRKSAEEKIKENNYKYPDIFVSISALPDIENKPFDMVTDFEVYHNLYLQIVALWGKISQEKINH